MKYLLFTFYTFAIRLSNVFIYIGRYFSDKLELLYQGRQSVWKKLEDFSLDNRNVVWFHCASLGEFEQGRPLIEKIKHEYPFIKILISFYSPSGYEIKKDYKLADLIIYLPSDLNTNNRKLIALINPAIVIFVKYEFWWNLINTLIEHRIKIFLVSAVFRDTDYFFSSFFKPFRVLLSGYEKIFVQDEMSAKTLIKNGLKNVSIAGDTRIDNVILRAESSVLPEQIKNYTLQKTVIIYGSVWLSDIEILVPLITYYPDFLHILAPHNVSKDYILKIQEKLGRPSDIYSDKTWKSNILLIDNIGMLSSLYKLAKYAYIGGGFEKGIHNILEPAIFGIPVFFGPNHKKFNEAVNMARLNIAFGVNSSAEAIGIISSFESDINKYKHLNQQISHFFKSNSGATEKIASEMAPFLD